MNRTVQTWLGQIGAGARDAAGGSLDEFVKGVEQKLVSAGEPGGLRGPDLFGLQLVSAVIFPLTATLILRQIPMFDFLFEGPKQILVYLGLIAFGFQFPMINIKERIEKRHKEIALQLPDALDLLTISVEAGLDFITALRRVVEKQRAGAFREEMERLFRQMELGRTRREALREMANRVQLPDLSVVVSALIQADKLGASIGPILRVQSDMARTRRGQRAEKAAQEAPVKMLAPLIVCIFPAVFIMIFAPIFIQMIQNYTR
ncbi:MAG: type II secretion system F family protein [Lentisphaerae bacterium]|nr:type II secretion system F family protein [Lentisphaerota bacterium]